MSAAASMGVSYAQTMPSCVSPPTVTDQYEATPLNGQVVSKVVGRNRSMRTSSFGT